MSGAERTRRFRRRRGRGRSRDVAWMIYLPVTFGDLEALVRLGKLSDGRLDKASVTEAVREVWAEVEIEKHVTRDI